MTVTFNLLLLFLHDVVQASDMRQDLHDEFVTAVEGQLGFSTPANAGGSSSDTKEIRGEFRGEQYPKHPVMRLNCRYRRSFGTTYIVVPGSSVVPWEQKLTNSGTSKMRSL